MKILLGLVVATGLLLACGIQSQPTSTPIPGPVLYCIDRSHSAYKALGPDPQPSDPHDYPRHVCTPDELPKATPTPTINPPALNPIPTKKA